MKYLFLTIFSFVLLTSCSDSEKEATKVDEKEEKKEINPLFFL